EMAGEDALHLQSQARHDAKHAESADGGVKEVAVVRGAAGEHLAGGKQDVEIEDVFAKGADAPVVLSMHIHGGASADGGEHSAGDDGGPPSVGQDAFPDLLDGNA